MVVSMTAGFHDGVMVMTTEAGDTLYGKAGESHDLLSVEKEIAILNFTECSGPKA